MSNPEVKGQGGRVGGGGGVHKGPGSIVLIVPSGKLDFPPVKLVREHSGTKVRIRNPFHFYKELKQFPIWDKEALVTIVSDSVRRIPTFL